MKKVLIILLTFIFLFTEISALCSEGQIDINTASKEELDKLYGIGPARAELIIQTRTFQSVDNLIDVVGIGEVTLANIKQQGLACVEGEEENTSEEESSQEDDIPEEEPQEEIKEENVIIEKNNKSEIIESLSEETKITGEETKTIVLNPKDIKSEIDKEQLKENKLAIYGLIVFSALLVILFVFKKRKKEKNEFK